MTGSGIYRWPIIGLILRLLRSMWGMMSCKIFTWLSSEALDRPLHPDERLSQTLHRKMCETCRTHERHLQQLHQLSAELPGVERELQTRSLSDEAKARLAAAVDAATGKQ